MRSNPADRFPAPADAGDATDAAASLSLDLWLLQGEAMGWQPLGAGAYWHGPAVAVEAPDVVAAEDAVLVVHVVGCPDPALAGLPVLLLT